MSGKRKRMLSWPHLTSTFWDKLCIFTFFFFLFHSLNLCLIFFDNYRSKTTPISIPLLGQRIQSAIPDRAGEHWSHLAVSQICLSYIRKHFHFYDFSFLFLVTLYVLQMPALLLFCTCWNSTFFFPFWIIF